MFLVVWFGYLVIDKDTDRFYSHLYLLELLYCFVNSVCYGLIPGEPNTTIRFGVSPRMHGSNLFENK